MKVLVSSTALLFLLMLCGPNSYAVESGLRCGKSLVRIGYTKYSVSKRCGKPAAKEIISRSTDKNTPIKEQWIYDFGQQKFLRILTFEGGKLIRIEKEAAVKGNNTSLGKTGIRCGTSLVKRGYTKYSVLKRCGKPAAKEIISRSTDKNTPIKEQWIYDFGDKKFLRILTFESGKLITIERGPRS